MKHRLMTTAIVFAVATFTCPAYAQQVGDACTPDASHIVTQKSVIQTQGVMECIPDSYNNYYWQPMGGGGTRYDSTAYCSIAGTLRWNGVAIEYCNGSNWQSVGGGSTLVVGGCLDSWASCPGGYHATSYFSPGTYNCCDRCGNPAWRYTVCSQ